MNTVKLVKFDESMAQSLSFHANSKKIADMLDENFPYPYTKDDALEFIAAACEREDDDFIARAITMNGEAVGCISALMGKGLSSKQAKIGYWLGECFWGMGIMTKALPEFCRQIFEKKDIVRISATVISGNIKSVNLLERCGFTLEGILKKSVFKNGEIKDSYIYSLLK